MNKQSSMFDEPPAAPPVRHAADKETPAAAEALTVAENESSGDVRATPAPVWDWLSSYVSGKG